MTQHHPLHVPEAWGEIDVSVIQEGELHPSLLAPELHVAIDADASLDNLVGCS
jgi:hypothetical protein